MYTGKTKRTKQEVLQQYFTNSTLANKLVEISNIKNDKRELINILEPSAGAGDLIRPILLSNKNTYISLVEFDPINRELLKELQTDYTTMIQLMNEPNFLLFMDSGRYDYIFMNPPFHLRKSEDFNLFRDVYDFDFVMRAFSFLKPNGVLYAIVGQTFLSNKMKSSPDVDEALQKFKNFSKQESILSFGYEIIKKQKFSEISVDVCIIKIVKKQSTLDNEILGIKYYKTQGLIGNQVAKNTYDINKVFDSKVSNEDLNKIKTEYKNNLEDDIKELDNILSTTKTNKSKIIKPKIEVKEEQNIKNKNNDFQKILL